MKRMLSIAMAFICIFLFAGCTDVPLKPEQKTIRVSSEADFGKISLTPIIAGEDDFNDDNAHNLNGLYILEDDITVDHLLYVARGADAAIDLNGHKIESRFEGFAIGNWGNLTIKDTSETKSGALCNTSKTFGNGNFGHDAIMNYGYLVIEGGTYGDIDLDQTNANPNSFGAALNNKKDAKAIIKSGSFTTGDNWTRPDTTVDFSYAIHNSGKLIVEDWHVYGKMYGGVSCDAGTIYLNGGKVEIDNPSSLFTLKADYQSDARIYITGGEYINNTEKGHLFSSFEGVSSWNVKDLEKSGYYVKGGRFIEAGKEKIF